MMLYHKITVIELVWEIVEIQLLSWPKAEFHLRLKVIYSEKATKVWKNLPLCFVIN